MAEEKSQSTTSKVADTAVGKATQTASKVASTATAKVAEAAAVSTGVGAVVAPIIGKAVGAITSFLTTKVGGFIQKHKGVVGAGLAGVGALAIGGLAGIPGLATLGTAALALVAIMALASFALAALLPFVIFFISLVLFTVFVLFIINSGAYLVPPAPQLGSALGNLPPGSTAISNPYIEVTKVADPPGPFQNGAVPNPITYTITVKAKQGALVNPRFDNKCNVLTARSSSTSDVIRESNPTCPAPIPIGNTPQTIDPGPGYTFKYTADYTSSAFTDALVTDTFTVTATVEGVGDQTAAATSGVVIGNPPAQCPNGWPMAYTPGIGQGPYTLPGNSHFGYEAEDLSAKLLTPIRATHAGIVHILDFRPRSYGLHVRIVSVCQGKQFVSLYAHLTAASVTEGQLITIEQQVGLSGGIPGIDGNVTGPHLHYEFRPANPLNGDFSIFPRSVQPVHMEPPYVPQ